MKRKGSTFADGIILGIGTGILLCTVLLGTASAETVDNDVEEVSAMCSAIMQVAAAAHEDGQAAADLLEESFWYNTYTDQTLVTIRMEEVSYALEDRPDEIWTIIENGVKLCRITKTAALAAVEKANDITKELDHQSVQDTD